MKLIKRLEVPTGDICLGQGTYGPLEFLSLSDYGKEKNVKADFLGLSRKLDGVPHGPTMPLSEKWVITISTQHGCLMQCQFCDVSLVKYNGNASLEDLVGQVLLAMSLHPEVQYSKRLNLHYARMGEPLLNFKNVLLSAQALEFHLREKFNLHPVISTMCPRSTRYWFSEMIENWLTFKNTRMKGEAGLQLSINTTSEIERDKMFNRKQLSLEDISSFLFKNLHDFVGRKIALNFALSNCEIDAKKLRSLFDPEFFMCKITPMHDTISCQKNGYKTNDGYTSFYPYEEVEDKLKEQGFDVIVFIPSIEEDASKITCGHVVLALQ